MKRYQHRKVLALLVACLMGANAAWATQSLDMAFQVSKGSGEEVMIVMWLEDDTGEFVKTLHMFSKHKKYFKDMKAWRFKSRKKEKLSDVNAVSGPTIKWGRTGRVSIPVIQGDLNLLAGNYVLRIESSKWKGKHFRKLKIPLPKGYAGGMHDGEGYVKTIEIKLNDKGGA